MTEQQIQAQDAPAIPSKAPRRWMRRSLWVLGPALVLGAGGWLYLTSDGRYFKPTLKGAYLMTWGELWPMQMFRKGKRNSREREILARFG